ncbi:MAG TPA: hypothetical protein VIT62_10195 [Lysobacter sp.]|jgi:threonine/homoserine/homoserine lactone efflux protein
MIIACALVFLVLGAWNIFQGMTEAIDEGAVDAFRVTAGIVCGFVGIAILMSRRR